MTIYIPPHQLGALAKSHRLKPEPKSKEQRNLERTKVKAAYDKLHARVQRSLIGLPNPDKEVLFHPTRKWRLDYAWPALKIGLEIHGGNHSNGRHVRGAGFAEDRAKMNEAQLCGWLILECTPDNIPSMREWLDRAFSLRKQLNETNGTN